MRLVVAATEAGLVDYPAVLSCLETNGSTMPTILILSVGSLVGSNILDAVEAFRPGLRVVGINSQAQAPNNFRCDHVYLAPPACEADAYWQRVEQVLEAENPDVILAGRDDDIPLMAHWREYYPRWADRFVCGGSQLALPMTDKLAGHDWATARDLPFAPTVAANAATATQQSTAWLSDFGALIAKPRSGNGSRGIRLLFDETALAATLGDIGLVIQPYLSDATPYRRLQENSNSGWPLFWTPALTQFVAQTVIGPDGEILGRFDMEATMIAGRCERATAFVDPEFRNIGDRYAAALAEAGWRGPVNVQAVHHPRLGFRIIEFCARAAGALYPRTLLGFDEMAMTLSAWTKKPFLRSPTLIATPVAVRLTRDVGLAVDHCDALQEKGEWPTSC